MSAKTILQIKNLDISFRTNAGVVHAIRGINLDLQKGETVAIVGESGSGKSTVGNCVMRNYDITDGTICFNGRDISRLPKNELRHLRKELQMITQDPFSSLDPRVTIRDIIMEGVRIQKLPGTPQEHHDLVDRMLMMVGLNPKFA